MCAEDHVDVGAAAGLRGGQRLAERELGPVRFGLPFRAPVHAHQDHVGARLPGRPRIRDDLVLLHQVDRPRLALGQGVAVGVVGVGEVRHLGGARRVRGHRGRLGGRTGRAGVLQADLVEAVQCAAQAGSPVVEGVVRGRGAAVVPGVLQPVRDLRRGLEGGITGEGAAFLPVDGLHVAEGEVGSGDHGLDAGEHRPEVVPVAVRVVRGALDDGGVRQYVAARDQGEALGGGRSGSGGGGGRSAGVPEVGRCGAPGGRTSGCGGQQHGRQEGEHLRPDSRGHAPCSH